MIPLLFLIFAASMAFPLLFSLVRPIYYPGRYAVIALPPSRGAAGRSFL